MSDRFSPGWQEVSPFWKRVTQIVDGNDRLLVDAFLSVADPALKAGSAIEVERHLRGLVIIPGIPWVLYDTVSALVSKLLGPMQKAIAALDGIENGYAGERLRVAEDGRWQITWQLEALETVALDWYVPPDRDGAPIVPASVIDFVGGSLALYRGKLILPAAANLLIALESVLWDRLSAQAHPRTTERTMYQAALWRYKVINRDRLQVFIDRADQALTDFEKVLGTKEGDFVLRKSHEEDGRVVLRLELDPAFVKYFASEIVSSREAVPQKGLAEAIQKARRLGLLETLPIQLDELLFRLRNGLIHLPHDGVLNPPVPNPGGGVIDNLEALRRDSRFVRQVVGTVVNLINTLYAKV